MAILHQTPLHSFANNLPICIVTGGAGFLGSHLCHRLLNDGHNVLCIDNFYTGSPDNILGFMANPCFQLLQADVIALETLDCIRISGITPAYILNFACPASPPAYQKNHLYTLKTAIYGTENFLALAKEMGATFFQASTSEVYGDPEIHPQPETYWGNVNPDGERSCYDEGKRVGETFCVAYGKQGVDVRIARFFNTYGPNMDPNDGRVVSNMICQALKGEPITIYGDGTQTRSFCYVDDLIEGITRLVFNCDHHGPVNLGNSGEFTMRELADLVKVLTNSESEIIFCSLPGDDPKKRQPNTALAENLLGGWTAQVSLEVGLRNTIPYFAHKLRIPNPIKNADLVKFAT